MYSAFVVLLTLGYKPHLTIYSYKVLFCCFKHIIYLTSVAIFYLFFLSWPN